MLYWVPIEPIEERYSRQWWVWFNKEFEKKRIPHRGIMGQNITTKIEKGSFLDICGTHYWKSSQIARISDLIHRGIVEDGDWFLFGDMWFPGLEALAYMRDALGIKIKIAGILHAGSYDPYDRLAAWNTEIWAKSLEESWFAAVDLIFVATNFHKKLLTENRDVDPSKIRVTGFPIYDEWSNADVKKENILLFPHRLDPEKQPHLFDELIRRITEPPGWKFFRSKDLCKTKKEYYDLLNRSKISISFALQETWGIAMQESVISGCLPIVPNRLSYEEMYFPVFRYDTMKESREMAIEFMSNGQAYQEELQIQRGIILENGAKAIHNMLLEMQLVRKETK